MSGQGSNGDAGVTLKLSGRQKRTSSDGGIENGTKAHQGMHPARPRHGSCSCVVCFGIDDSTLCEQTFNWYLDHMHRERSYLVLINCVELPSLYSYQEVYTPSAMWQTTLRREAEQAQQLEEKYVNKLKGHNDTSDSFNDWFEHCHDMKSEKPLMAPGTSFTERVAFEHRQKQYENELDRWRHTLMMQTKVFQRGELQNFLQKLHESSIALLESGFDALSYKFEKQPNTVHCGRT